MRVDVRTLGAFDDLARDGAERAADDLAQLSGVDCRVDVTAIDLVSTEDMAATLTADDRRTVTVGFDGGLDGDCHLVFDEPGARRLASTLPGDDPGTEDEVRDRITEVGNIVASGFIASLADHLGTAIEQRPPSMGSAPAIDAATADHVLAFTGELATAATAPTFHASVYLVLDEPAFDRLATDDHDDGDAPVPLEKLSLFNHMNARGAELASENLTAMAGIDAAVDVSRIRFLPVTRAPARLPEEPHVGVTFELDGVTSGHLLLLFDEPSARTVAEALGAGGDGASFGAMHRSAIEELGNVMCSGFVDGWANVLGSSIGYSTPEFVRDMPAAIVESILARLARSQEYVFLLDSAISTPDESASCRVYLFPDEAEFTAALSALDVPADDGAAIDETLAGEMRADPDDVFDGA